MTVKQPGCWVGTVTYKNGGLSDGACLEAIERTLVFECSVFSYDQDQDVKIAMFMSGESAHFECLGETDEEWREVHSRELRSVVHLILNEMAKEIHTVPAEYRVEALRLLGVMVVAKLIGVDEE